MRYVAASFIVGWMLLFNIFFVISSNLNDVGFTGRTEDNGRKVHRVSAASKHQVRTENIASAESYDVKGASLVVNTENNTEEQIAESIYSKITLRDQTLEVAIDQRDIKYVLGYETKTTEAKSQLKRNGLARVEERVKTKLADYGKSAYEKNVDGISQDTIKGFEFYLSSYQPDYKKLSERVYEIVEKRIENNSGHGEVVQIVTEYKPGTAGEFTDGKYVELDQSAQRIYAWEDGELWKTWSASGFYDEYAVYGVFRIKNKSENAWSDIAEKWMPYWMAFHYDTKQGAWFGIHELVYWYDEDGNYYEESSDSIGSKKSGGCVRLDRGEMDELYNWAEVGTYFLIHH